MERCPLKRRRPRRRLKLAIEVIPDRDASLRPIAPFIGKSTSLAADYKPEFKMSLNVNQDNSWGQAAKRFADAIRENPANKSSR
jgi:hypothetical protein